MVTSSMTVRITRRAMTRLVYRELRRSGLGSALSALGALWAARSVELRVTAAGK